MLDRKTLIKNIAIGFIPLFMFILADELFGLTIGLIVAIISGVGEAGYSYWREKRIDRFILFDTGLIVLLGGVSLSLHNDLFIKLKPGLVELILLVLLGVSGFSRHSLILKMTGRYLKDVEFSDVQVQQMRILMRRMFYVIAVHTALIFYSAFYMSTEAWGFISGGLFYILIGAMALLEFVRGRRVRKRLLEQAKSEEWFDILSPEGQVVGQAPRSAVHGNPELIHPVVHLHIFNAAGELYLQKRAANKDLLPNYWDTAVGGHVRSGETIEMALRREAEEELGITVLNVNPAFRYLHRNSYESELVHSFVLRDEGPFFINREEIAEGRFWKMAEIEFRLGEGIFTPNFVREFQLLKKAMLPYLK